MLNEVPLSSRVNRRVTYILLSNPSKYALSAGTVISVDGHLTTVEWDDGSTTTHTASQLLVISPVQAEEMAKAKREADIERKGMIKARAALKKKKTFRGWDWGEKIQRAHL